MDIKANHLLELNKIFELLSQKTATSLGKDRVASLLPSSDRNEIAVRLQETSDAAAVLWRKGMPPFGGVSDLRSAFKRLELGSTLSCAELLRVGDFLRGTRLLKQYLAQDVPEGWDTNVVVLSGRSMTVNKAVEEEISKAILSEDEVADHASPELYNVRRNIRTRQDSIKDKLNSILRNSDFKKVMQDAVITMRGDRYVIPVKQEYRNMVHGLVHDMSASGATVFIEPMAVVETNNEIRELMVREQHEIERILAALSALAAEIVEDLKLNLTLATDIDFLFAKAKLSRDMHAICPQLAEDRSVHIKRGRHPLLDPKQVVPIDVTLGKEFTTLVITGPNTGGKTVTLKTVGLFVLMTQSGLHIPADEGSAIGVFSNVFADIGDEQSIEQSLSTFSSHMRNIVRILLEVDDDALVLFDELGAGTDPTEGAALAMAILETLRSREIRAMATTHYSELKIYAMTTKRVENACCEFDVETLRPTYHLLVGIPGKSNAFAISNRLGLTNDIIEKAQAYLTQDNIRFEDVLHDIEKNRAAIQEDRAFAADQRRQSEQLKSEIDRERQKIKAERDRLMSDAKREARQIIIDARADAEQLLDKLKQMEKDADAKSRDRAYMEMKTGLKQRLNELESSLAEAALPREGYAESPTNLKPGETVHVLSLNQKAVVLDKPDNSGEVTVQAGIMKVKVHISQLKRVDEQKQAIDKIQQGKISRVKAAPVGLELDLRGLLAEEAIDKADKYLDNAVMAGLHEVMLIHGKGTGALRKAIHDFLKTRPHVQEFRIGQYGEGESGVTVVSLE